MNLALIIIIALLVAAALELLLLFIWIITEAVIVTRFKKIKSVDTDFFKEKSCNGIPYIEERGIPYKGTIDSKTNVRVWLNSAFKFALDSPFTSPTGILGNAEIVDIPHCYNKVESPLRDYRGDVWYEKTFNYTKVDNKPRVRLVFMGSFLTTDVWLDGVHLGQNKEGYLPFTFDISHLEEGEHKLVIKVNNVSTLKTIPITLFEGHKVGWHHFSGLHKEIFIEYSPDYSVFKLSCIPDHSGAKWFVNCSVLMERKEVGSNELIATEINIISNKDKIVATQSVKVPFVKGERVGGTSVIIDVDKPELWSENNPVLYTAVIKSEYEESSVKFGFRKITWGEGKIRINGEEIFLRGVCRHEDNGDKGMETDAAIINNELRLIQKLNGNFVRLAHYPHSKVTMDSTDLAGMYVWAEVPFYQAGHRITHDSFGKEFGYVKVKLSRFKNVLLSFRQTALARDKTLLTITAQSLMKLVERDINHPSIITWGVGNEIWSVNEATGKALNWLKEKVKSFDSSRAVNYAAMCMPVLTIPCESSFKYMDWACINEYFGWYYGKVDGVGKLVKGIHKKYPDKPLVITETGSDTVLGLRDYNYPPTNKHSEDYQKYFLEETWKNLLTVPNFSGLAVWVFKDFPCPEYAVNNPVLYYNMKGLFTKNMKEKISYKALANLYETKK